MTETGFSEGGETLLSIELRGCLALIFILSAPVFSSRLGEKRVNMVEILQTKSLIGSHGHMKPTSVRYIFKTFFSPQTKNTLFFHFKRKKEGGKKMTKRSEVITFKALIAQRGKKGMTGLVN